MQILILEDDPGIVSFLEKGLHAEGYQTTIVSKGIDAAAALEAPQGHIDLVLLDLGLPSDDGVEILRAWRSGGHDLPVIILTAAPRSATRSKGSTREPTTTSPSRLLSMSSWRGSALRCARWNSRARRSWPYSISASIY